MINWIKEKLGINEIQKNVWFINENIQSMNHTLSQLNLIIRAESSALGRIIAKLDPMVGVPETDTKRMQESNKLGEEIIEKLMAEQRVRDHYGYTNQG